jgi:hypothetical protein
LFDGRETQIESGQWMQTIYIDHEEKPFNDYKINLSYYLDKIKKEIAGLEPNRNQLKLF